jgi:hypothetical protein
MNKNDYLSDREYLALVDAQEVDNPFSRETPENIREKEVKTNGPKRSEKD